MQMKHTSIYTYADQNFYISSNYSGDLDADRTQIIIFYGSCNKFRQSLFAQVELHPYSAVLSGPLLIAILLHVFEAVCCRDLGKLSFQLKQ